MPLNSVARQTVFAESGESVETVIVDGQIVLHDRIATKISEQDLYQEVNSLMPKLKSDMEQVLERNSKMHRELLEAWRQTWNTNVGLNRYVGNRDI